jgi:DNA-directed RNA polymerase specialized sigma24 family protein
MSDVHATTASIMSGQSISTTDICVLLREANAASRRLVRGLGLPNHDHEDLRQDLLVDLIARLKWFSPDRGSLGAFAGTVSRHRTLRLANRIYRERTVFAPACDRSPDWDEAGVSDAGGDVELPFCGQFPDDFGEIDRRIDLCRALDKLSRADLRLCAKLIERTPTEIIRGGRCSRASVYRQIKRIRLHLLGEGVSWP